MSPEAPVTPDAPTSEVDPNAVAAAQHLISEAPVAPAAEAAPLRFGDVSSVEPGSDADKLLAHNLAQNQANIARMTPPMPGSVDAGAPEAVPAAPDSIIGPPPTATPEQEAEALAAMPKFDAPAPKPEVPVTYPPIDDQARNITIIKGN